MCKDSSELESSGLAQKTPAIPQLPTPTCSSRTPVHTRARSSIDGLQSEVCEEPAKLLPPASACPASQARSPCKPSPGQRERSGAPINFATPNFEIRRPWTPRQAVHQTSTVPWAMPLAHHAHDRFVREHCANLGGKTTRSIDVEGLGALAHWRYSKRPMRAVINCSLKLKAEKSCS